MWLRVARGGDEQEQLRARLFRVQGQPKKSPEDIEDISQRRDVAGGLAAAANAVRSCACAPRGLLARSQDLRELVALWAAACHVPKLGYHSDRARCLIWSP